MQGDKPRRSPLRVGLYAFGLTLVLGLIVGVTLIMVIDSGASPEARGERFGQGLAPLALVVGAVAYYIQWRRTRD